MSRYEELLPKSADGVPLAPGMDLHREYRGSTWEARVVAVRRGSIDIQYTNEASHGAKGHVRVRSNPSKWEAS